MIFRVLFCANLCAIGVGISWPYNGPDDAFNSLVMGSGVGFLAGTLIGLAIEIVSSKLNAQQSRTEFPRHRPGAGHSSLAEAENLQRRQKLEEALAELDAARADLQKVSSLLKASASEQHGGRVPGVQ